MAGLFLKVLFKWVDYLDAILDFFCHIASGCCLECPPDSLGDPSGCVPTFRSEGYYSTSHSSVLRNPPLKMSKSY